VLAKSLATAVVLVAALLMFPQPASADQLICPPNPLLPCVIQIGDPGSGGGGGTTPPPGAGGGSGEPTCVDDTGTPVPCYSPLFGWWDAADGCYYRLAAPQPPAGDPVWKGHQPGDGAVYDSTCLGVTGTGGGQIWMADPPAGFGGALPSAAVLAQQALARMPFPPVQIAMAPAEHTYVNFPTILWIPAGQWHELSATAAIGSRSITLTATPDSMTWEMGDGGVSCAGPGTPWEPNGQDEQSSACTFTYTHSSIGRPGTGNDRGYSVRAIVTYELHWVCAGNCDQAGGDLPPREVPSQPARLRVLERQSVVVGSR
jgi:hypothetical protein